MFRSPVTWVIILGVTVAGGAYILWRRRNAASSGSATTGSTDAGAAGTATDYSAALGTIQTEVADLQSSEAQGETTTSTSTSSKTAPKTPPAITVVSPRTGAVDISWTAVPGASGYELDITGPQGSAIGAPKVAATHTRVSLPAGKKGLHVKVRAYNSAGAGPWSAGRRFNVGAGAARVPVRKAA